MVNYYLGLDILFLILLIFTCYYSYQRKIYLKIFHYFKIFFIITVSAKLASYTGVLLQKLYITKADTYTTLILIAFVVNMIIIYFSWKYIFQLTQKYVNNEKLKVLFAKLFTGIEVLIIVTFSLYIIMQVYIVKIYIYPTMKKTYSYPKIEKFYKAFLNDDFVNMVLGSDTGTNHKEVIFKSFKNSL
jgi:hypothetical protein